MERREGVTSLATMLILGAVVVQIGLVVFILSYYLTSSNAGVKFSSYAFSAAQAGIEEGILRVVRGDYTNAMPFSVGATGGATVSVTICKGGTPNGSGCIIDDVSNMDIDLVQVVSASGSFNKQSLLVAILEVHPITRLVRIVSVTGEDLTSP